MANDLLYDRFVDHVFARALAGRIPASPDRSVQLCGFNALCAEEQAWTVMMRACQVCSEQGFRGRKRVRLDPYVRDYSSFVEDISAVLDQPRTRVYLDTSLLMWLIRLGARARGEFLDWARSRPAGTVRVPVWCAHELHTHTVRKSIDKTIGAVSDEAEKKYVEFARFAAERADDEACRRKGFTGRAGFIADVQNSLAKLKRLKEVVSDKTNLAVATDEVVAFVNDHILDTDINPIVRDVSQNGEIRYSHHMPPGFHDKKPDDRFGDLIIWQEIAADMPKVKARERNRPAAVLISRDAKTDWVSSAPNVLDPSDKISVPNRDAGLDVTLAHPLLVHEFASMTKGCSIYVVQPSALAAALTAAGGDGAPPIATWLAAAYRPDQIDNVIRLAARHADRASRAEPEGGQQQEPTPPRGASPVEEAPFVAPPVADLLAPKIRALVASKVQAGRAEQVAATAEWIAEAADGHLLPVELGARLAALHVATSRTADLPAIVEAAAGQLAPNIRRAVALTIGVHAFLAAPGRHHRPPIVPLVNALNVMAADTELKPAFDALAVILEESGGTLLHVPGRRPGPSFQLDLAEGPENRPRRLKAIKIAGQNVLAETDDDDGPGTLSRIIGANQATGAEVRLALAERYGIEPDVLAKTVDGKKIRWNGAAGLAELDPDAPGGVSPLENGDDT